MPGKMEDEVDAVGKICNVVRDLMVLYEDDACSEESKSMVDAHVEECAACAEYMRQLRHAEELLLPEPDTEEKKQKEADEPQKEPDEEKAVKRSFRKIRRRWVASLWLALIQLPLLGLVLLGVHEALGEGIAFTNLDDIARCLRYLNRIEKKDFEGAAACVDFSAWNYRNVDSVSGMTEEEIESYMRQRLVEKLQQYDSLGLSIGRVRYEDSYRLDSGSWCVEIGVDEKYPDGSSQRLEVSLDGGDLCMGSLRMLTKQEEQMIYLGELLYLHTEDDPLGYLDYETAFTVDAGETASIAWNGEGLGLDAGDIWTVALIHQGFGTAMDIRDRFLSGEEIEIPVAGKYAVIACTYQREDVNLADRLEITRHETGESGADG